MNCKIKDIINVVKGIQTTRFEDGDTEDIISVILDVDQRSVKSIKPTGVECLRGRTDRETLYNVWAFVRNNVTYIADGRTQAVKSPGALYGRGVGDCKSFSIAVVALLRALGYNDVSYRFTKYKNDTDYTHVYVIAKKSNQRYIIDSVHTRFDSEVAYLAKKDIYVGGKIGSVPVERSNNNLALIALFIVGLIVIK
jgi:hypothetical protein